MGQPGFDAETWMVAVNCLGHTDLFFAPDRMESRGERAFRESRAKAVCHECVVQSYCLAEALKSEERFGIWGGLTERERRAMRRSVAAGADEEHGTESSLPPVRLTVAAMRSAAGSQADRT